MPAAFIPQNQLNALPLLTEAAIGSPGQITFFGSAIVRYWSPSALGVQNAARLLGTSGGYLVSNYIDVRGCQHYAITIERTVHNAGEDADIAGPNLYVQYEASNGTDQPPDKALHGLLTGVGIGSGGLTPWPGTPFGGAYPQTQIAAACWSNANTPAAVGSGFATLVGKVRLFFFFSTAPPAAITWSVAMWGQS